MKKILGILSMAFSINAFATDCTPLVKGDDTCAIKVFIPMLHCKNNGDSLEIPVNTLDIPNKTTLQNSIIATCNEYFQATTYKRTVPAPFDGADSIVVFKLTK